MRRSEALDQYFTKRDIAGHLYSLTDELAKLHNIEFDYWLEPAAGDGAFFDLLPIGRRLGIDIEKVIDDVCENDFLAFDDFGYLRYGTIGNPPFGKNSNLAIKFFNLCARVSSFVAFIVPRTFRKDSVINKLDRSFHLLHERILPDNSFEIDGQEKCVPCVFQVWLRHARHREKIEILRQTDDLEFLSRDRLDQATVLFQRVGVRAGALKDPLDPSAAKSPESHFYIRCSNDALDVLAELTWDHIKHNTAGNPSISKSDLIKSYETLKEQLKNPG